jgi:Fe-S-cluster containining protein
VPLLQEDIDRLTAMGYYDVYFSEDYNGAKFIRKLEGKCIFLQAGKCEVFDNRPKRCRSPQITYDDNTKSVLILESCKYKSTYEMTSNDIDYMEEFIKLLIKEIEMRIKYESPKVNTSDIKEKLVVIK